MPQTPPPAKPRHLRLSDIRAAARLAVTGTQGASRVVEGVHASVLRTLGLPVNSAADGSTAGITGFVYGGVRRVAGWVGQGLDATLAQLQPLVNDANAPSTPQRDAFLAALNGVLGDQLEASGNSLATPMSLRYLGQPLDSAILRADPAVTAKIVLLVHGLCMNDRQWQANEHPAPHASQLAAALGYTPVYLRYNSGRHISDNGRELALQLQRLVAQWPQAVEEIAVVAHSMGGLVVRSACEQAQTANPPADWLPLLKKIAFLGTPHHGAPLERAGHGVDLLLGASRFSAPLAKLGQVRSAGITDLRHGHLLAQDWAGHDRFDATPDTRTPVPLPPGVACYALAATTSAPGSSRSHQLRNHWVGDGLVPLTSALGQHPNTAMQLAFAHENQAIIHDLGHLQLLTDPRVSQQLLNWFGAPSRAKNH